MSSEFQLSSEYPTFVISYHATMSITHNIEADKLTADFIEYVKRVFKGKRIRVTVEEVNTCSEHDTSEVPQVGEPSEQYLTTNTLEHTDAMHEQIMEQALKAEEEIHDGKGLTASEARAFMNAAFKA